MLTRIAVFCDKLLEAGWLAALIVTPLFFNVYSSRVFEPVGPIIDVYEDKDNVYVRAELPGMRKEDIDLSLHEGSLSISGERKSEEHGQEAEMYRAERFFGRFQRTVTLPTPVATDRRAPYDFDVSLPATAIPGELVTLRLVAVDGAGNVG